MTRLQAAELRFERMEEGEEGLATAAALLVLVEGREAVGAMGGEERDGMALGVVLLAAAADDIIACGAASAVAVKRRTRDVGFILID